MAHEPHPNDSLADLTAKALRADLHAHQKLTREQLEATRDMRDQMALSTSAMTALAETIRHNTGVMTAVLAEMRLLRETVASLVKPAPHANGAAEEHGGSTD